MKHVYVPTQSFSEPLECFVGQSQKDNDLVIDSGENDDMWFHAADESSCHVVVRVPTNMKKEQVKYLVKVGAQLCKQHTKKLASEKRVKFHYTCLSNVSKTSISGQVILKHWKEVVL